MLRPGHSMRRATADVFVEATPTVIFALDEDIDGGGDTRRQRGSGGHRLCAGAGRYGPSSADLRAVDAMFVKARSRTGGGIMQHPPQQPIRVVVGGFEAGP